MLAVTGLDIPHLEKQIRAINQNVPPHRQVKSANAQQVLTALQTLL